MVIQKWYDDNFLLIVFFYFSCFRVCLRLNRKEHYQAAIKNYNTRGDDRMCLYELVKLAMERIFKKMVV